MAWTTPKSWTSSQVTSTILNAQIKANEDVLSAHAHSGAAGNGSSTLSGVSLSALVVLVLAAPGGSPSSAAPYQLRRVGNNLEYYGAALVGLYADGAAGVATLRTLGTGSTQAAAGNHSH